ncbi:MAG: hypothetical protein Q4G19_01455 [Clostridia bacterium]|nr:hypothetical protein [Clostridia bacterium]
MKTQEKKQKLSIVSMMHYVRLLYRTVLFIWLAVDYILNHICRKEPIDGWLEQQPVILIVTWTVFVIEMILRFFPSRFESPGCQKQFARNYAKSGKTEIVIPDNHATVLVALLWIVFNGIFGALNMLGILDDGVMILLSSAYSVCDMICILFFCPFQTWFMKNKCCSACRIYNWDYAMMFTPLFFVRRSYSWSLLALSVALLIRWEITCFRHPERFSENTNDYLRCANCTEKLCTHKKQLMSLWQEAEAYTQERIRRLKRE